MKEPKQNSVYFNENKCGLSKCDVDEFSVFLHSGKEGTDEAFICIDGKP